MTLVNSLRSLDSIVQTAENEFFGWERLVDPCHIYKLLYSLQLIQALIDVGYSARKASVLFEFDPNWPLKFI